MLQNIDHSKIVYAIDMMFGLLGDSKCTYAECEHVAELLMAEIKAHRDDLEYDTFTDCYHGVKSRDVGNWFFNRYCKYVGEEN